VPIVRAGGDPERSILDVLSQAPVSSTVAVRSMIGASACYAQAELLPNAAGAAEEASRQRWMSVLGLRALGVAGLPYIAQLVAHADPLPLLRLPYTVDAGAPPEQQASAWQAIASYLRGLRGRRTHARQSEDPRTQTALLTLLARRSLMLERVRAGLLDTVGGTAGKLVEAHLRLDHPAVSEAQMLSSTATLRIGETRSAAGAVLAGSAQVPPHSVRPMIEHLDDRLVSGAIDALRYADYAETVAAAEAVAALAPDRAALLMGEALDVASHRLDAWVTSLATRRLLDLRRRSPAGITLGAWGAVEDLVRRPPRPTVGNPPEDAPTPLYADRAGGGYVLAPSLTQAATAAVLRAGLLAHARTDPGASALAIDLSGSRVRTALWLLAGVRQGQSLGALLGYRAERMLHERGAHVAVEVLRELAPPPVVTEEGTPEGTSALMRSTWCMSRWCLERSGMPACLASPKERLSTRAETRDSPPCWRSPRRCVSCSSALAPAADSISLGPRTAVAW
jgi:hypothetical protein